jgi:hypothetical protein
MPANGRWDLIRRLKVKMRHILVVVCQGMALILFIVVLILTQQNIW